jgi:hypothetical protein
VTLLSALVVLIVVIAAAGAIAIMLAVSDAGNTPVLAPAPQSTTLTVLTHAS